MAEFPRAPLAQVLQQDASYITELEPHLYPKLSVKLYGRGVVMDTPTDGSTVKMNRHQLAKSGQVILSEIWAKKGAIGIVPPEGRGALVTSHFFLFDIDESQLLPSFLYWLLNGNYFADELDAQAHGTTGYAAIRPKQFLSLEIPLPPLAEQQRIVARVEALARRVEEARGLRREAAEAAEALVDSEARQLLANVRKPTSELREWLDIGRNGIQTGPFGAQLSSDDFVELGVPLVTIGNVQPGGLTTDNLKYVTAEKAKELERFRIKPGDILFARMGTVGRSCVVPASAVDWLFNYHIIRVALDSDRAEPRYIHWIIRASSDVQKFLNEKIRGATRQGVNSDIVGSLPCRVPDISEQQAIVTYLDGLQTKVDDLRRLQAESQKELDALMPSILAKAFAGEL